MEHWSKIDSAIVIVSPRTFFTLNYNGARHGKGPMDGVGRAVKNVVFLQGKSRKVVIHSLIEFCNATNKFLSSIQCLY